MIKIFPFFFIVLWSSAFITTKPIIDNSEPFSALAFRFLFVALGFYIFTIYTKQKIFVPQKKIIESVLSGILFHGFYLGGVFFSISRGMPTGIAALIVTLQPILTNILAGPFLKVSILKMCARETAICRQQLSNSGFCYKIQTSDILYRIRLVARAETHCSQPRPSTICDNTS